MSQPRDAHLNSKILNERLIAKLRLRHLRLLTALERNTTLREAAQEVGITQPAASQILRELEDMLEIQLFDRHARGMRATEAGRFMLQQSRQMLNSVGYTAEALAKTALGYQRPLQIGAIPAALSGVVRPHMEHLRQALAGWHVSFHEGTPEDMLASLQAGSMQLVLLRQPEYLPDHKLVFTELLADELVVVASPEHPAARRKVVDLADLASHPWSLPVGTLATARVFDIACHDAGFAPQPAKMQSISSTLLLSITQDARTLAALPRSLAAPWLDSGELSLIKLRQAIPLAPLGALHHADEISAAVQTAMNALKPAGHKKQRQR